MVDRAVDAELSKQETVVLPPEEKLLVYIPNKDQFTEEALDSHLLWSGDSEVLVLVRHPIDPCRLSEGLESLTSKMTIKCRSYSIPGL